MRLIDADALKKVLDIAEKCNDCRYGLRCFGMISALKVFEAVGDAPTIEAESAWKRASVPPQESGTYLTVWALCKNEKPFCSFKILNYGNFEDWNDELKSKMGWWEFDREWGVCDMTESVLYWMPLPEPPKEDWS